MAVLIVEGVPEPTQPIPALAPSGLVLVSVSPTVSAAPTAGQGIALDAAGLIPATAPATAIQVLTADPTDPVVGQIWYRSDTSELCIRHDATTTKQVTFA